MTEWLQSGDSQATGPGISDDSGDVEGSEPVATGKPARAEKLEQKDKIQELIDTNFKFYKQINDDEKFKEFFLDWVFERYVEREEAE